MSLDDRAADRQSHAHAFGLGGVEGMKQPVEVRLIEARPGILNFENNSFESALPATIVMLPCGAEIEPLLITAPGVSDAKKLLLGKLLFT